MGILDDLTDSINSTLKSGSEAASRASNKLKLAGMLKQIEQRKTAAYTRLGESLAPDITRYPELLEGREQLMAEIASAEAYKAMLVQELKSMDEGNDGQPHQMDSHVVQILEDAYQYQDGGVELTMCPICGSAVAPNDKFCNVCGAPIAAAYDQPPAGYGYGGGPVFVCPICGQPIAQGDTFCTTCGTQLDWGGATTQQQPPQQPPQQQTQGTAWTDPWTTSEEPAYETPGSSAGGCFCNNCGAPMSSADRFCGMCGCQF